MEAVVDSPPARYPFKRMKRCSVCATQYPDGQKFCPRDGSPLESSPPVESTFTVGKTGELTLPYGAEAAAPIILDNRYRLGTKIDTGGTGTIYKARRLLVGDDVAVKILRPELVRDNVAVERFRRHAQVAARIKHPNSVQILDFGQTPEGAVYVVQELLSGRTLRDLLRTERSLTIRRTASILNQICGAVHAAHLNGIVLRSLRPESIYVEKDANGKEVVKVGGYGLAKITSSTAADVLDFASKFLGAPEYMSPEQWLGQPLDSRSDVYSLGCIVFEMLTGGPPFVAGSPQEVRELHLNAPPPDLTDFGRPDVDEGDEVVVNRALEKDPAKRQSTALLLAREFEAASLVTGGILGTLVRKESGVAPLVVPEAPAPAPEGEAALPSVAAEPKVRGRGAFNHVVIALMAEAFFSQISKGLIKSVVPLYALFVIGMSPVFVLLMDTVQDAVPIMFKSLFGSLADRFGKKRIFVISLVVRSAIGLFYAVTTSTAMMFVVKLVQGLSDSAKGPSASAMIADYTDETQIARAYSWYNTVKSSSGGFGESIAFAMVPFIIVFFTSVPIVTAQIATLAEKDSKGKTVEVYLADPAVYDPADQTIPGKEDEPENRRKVATLEQRQMALGDVPFDQLPKVVPYDPLRNTMIVMFVVAAIFSFISPILIQIFIKPDKPASKAEKPATAQLARPVGEGPPEPAAKGPNVWAFATLGAVLSAPAQLLSGSFFTILAIQLGVLPTAMFWIKLLSETVIPLFFGPFFGWLADRIGPGRVIALRSTSNIISSLLIVSTQWMSGTALVSLAIGVARGFDEMGKAAFKPTWGAIMAKVSSHDLKNRARSMGIMEGGTDLASMVVPPLAGIINRVLSIVPLMGLRVAVAFVAEFWGRTLMKRNKIF
jgi:eukaryotic-like serine/threonine-protein kinase